MVKCVSVLLVSGKKEYRDVFLEEVSHESIVKTERKPFDERIEMISEWSPDIHWVSDLSKQHPKLTLDLVFYVNHEPLRFYSHIKYRKGSGRQMLFDNFNDDYVYNDKKDIWTTRGKLKQFLERYRMSL